MARSSNCPAASQYVKSRFGKTVMAAMIAAFFGKTDAQDSLFDNLIIANTAAYTTHLHKHSVIYIDLSRTPENCCSYTDYITRITNGLKEDLQNEFPELASDNTRSLWDILQNIYEKTKTRFLFILDEWDAVFHMSFITQTEQSKYLLFLKNLLKDQIYAELVYMTGILPIAKYSSGSELNMFVEYDMALSQKFCEHFGFLNTEADRLYEIYQNTVKTPQFTR